MSATRSAAKGDAENPVDATELASKAHDLLVGGGMAEADAAQFILTVKSLIEDRPVRELDLFKLGPRLASGLNRHTLRRLTRMPATETHDEIRAAVRKLCEEFPGEYWRRLDERREYPAEFVSALTDAGYLSALIPEEYGGAGLTLSAAAAVLEEIQRAGCNGGACHAQMYVMGTVLRHGSEAQKAKYLPGIASGELRMQAFGVTEPTSGTDTSSTRTFAKRDGDHYIVNAENLVGEEGKGFRYILSGMNAERILIAAECVGDAKWLIEKASNYACERQVFGRPIGANQGIQFPIARAYANMRAAELMVREATRLYEAGQDCGAEANMAKMLAADASNEAANACIQTHVISQAVSGMDRPADSVRGRPDRKARFELPGDLRPASCSVPKRAGAGRDSLVPLTGNRPDGRARRRWPSRQEQGHATCPPCLDACGRAARFETVAALHIGDRVTRVSTIADITRKEGRTGELWFVTVDHEYRTPRGLAIRDRQNIVYRQAASLSMPEKRETHGEEARPHVSLMDRSYIVRSPVSLFGHQFQRTPHSLR
ncbi:hypothetical protein KSW81_003257 [Nannochloris sp. 'desiccata']|nr:hypothetical protein KSW81_003257 [Chlorella desiccata (nom. nud.)]